MGQSTLMYAVIPINTLLPMLSLRTLYQFSAVQYLLGLRLELSVSMQTTRRSVKVAQGRY